MVISLDLGPNRKLDPSVRLRLRIPPLSDDELFEVCRRNEGWRIERDPNGDLLARPVFGAVAGLQIAALFAQMEQWAQRTGLGVAFGPTVGMCLADGAMRSPSAAW